MKKCNICDSDVDLDEGGTNGYFGISPVSFCVWCLSSLTDMVVQLQGFDNIEILEERLNELKYERKSNSR